MSARKALDEQLVALVVKVRRAASMHADADVPNVALRQACYSARKRLLEAERILAGLER